MSLNTKSIIDHNLRAAATLIDRAIGKKGDEQVTAADLAKAAALIEKKAQGGVVDELTPLQLNVIKSALPDLQKLLGADDAKKTKPRALTPFATGLWTSAIADPKVRDCAAAIAGALDGGEQLQLGRFLDARDALAGVLSGQPPPAGREAKVAVAADALKAAIASGVVNKEAVEALNLFFLEGDIGGIMSHGPVKISGIKYDDVYRLPLDAPKPSSKHGDEADYGAAIDQYEVRFRDVRYDRIYIKGKDGELYVALHKAGKLEKVDENYGVTMRDEQNRAASGKVLRAVDIPNSLGEATWDLWIDGVVHGFEALTSGFKKAGSEAVDKAVSRAVDAMGDDKDKDKKTDFGKLGVAIYAAVTTGAAAFNLPVVLGLLGVGAVGITAGSVISWLQKSYDVAPIFQQFTDINRPTAVSP